MPLPEGGRSETARQRSPLSASALDLGAEAPRTGRPPIPPGVQMKFRTYIARTLQRSPLVHRLRGPAARNSAIAIVVAVVALSVLLLRVLPPGGASPADASANAA